ncbi:AMP-binding protein [Legionella cardiaca]|uniref:AMP-binding protein n=1 Tax=Legionella cardiaca TaxID=1071983 RepID=A0ABY8AU06_9GAMM|nr:AMP-binding protein [Legionella cardiaca]WED43000.1 AMP-binding protein [Legionella cardiaca]
MNLSRNEIESRLLSITREFLLELEAERALQAITLKASLERELGIGSLGKTELFHRIEKSFSIQLPESAMIKAESLGELAKLIHQMSGDSSTTATSKFSPILESLSLNLTSATTLLDVISAYATKESKRPHIYLQNEQGQEHVMRYGQLFEKALLVSNGLWKRGIQQGETVAIMLPTSEEFFYAFCGILLAGAVPVPIYPPFRPGEIEEYAKREAKILQNAQARILITFTQAKNLSKILGTFIPSLKEVITLKNLQTTDVSPPNLSINLNDIALIQYTSGSTGDPKGVTLTHANILANIRAIGKSVVIQPTDVCISWLPLYHDMGLMTWLASLYFGIPVTILSPLTFLARPERWLWTIHYHRGTLSGGPNFAYELCVKKINLKDIEGLDLSSWRFAFNGAEAINPHTLTQFSKKFSPYGFNIEAFAPVYGLAETTVGLTFPETKRTPRIDKIQRSPFEKENKAIPASQDTKTIEIVACGIPLIDHDIRIVDAAGTVLPERMVGSIQFKGPSAMQGYYGNPAATEKAFHDGWWDTGDLGYLADRELFITGRKKDLIIKAGRNIYPEEIEEVISHIPEIRKGCIVAFGVNDPDSGTEQLIVVAEAYERMKEKQRTIRAEITQKMTATIGLPPDIILLVPPKTIPKTSSGKLQRSACKKAYIEGKLTTGHLPVKMQLVKLLLQSFYKKISNSVTYLGKLLYTFYGSVLLILIFLLVWLIILPLPREVSAKIIKFCTGLYCHLIVCPIKVQKKTRHHPLDKPMVFVTNHASYIDSLVLLSVLPPGVVFVAKKELLKVPFISTFIKKLNFITVDRMDFAKSLENIKQITERVHQGMSIVIFPEGTFTYATGLRPFKLGAFTVAVETTTPICPVTLCGTRAILRGDSILAKPGTIKVTIGTPIYPQGNDWNEIIRLHSLVRNEIAKHCGEPVIDVIVAGPVTE